MSMPTSEAAALARRRGIMDTVIWMRGLGILFLFALPLVPWFWLAILLYIARGTVNHGTSGVRQALAAALHAPNDAGWHRACKTFHCNCRAPSAPRWEACCSMRAT